MQSTEYKNDFKKKNYDQIVIALPKGKKELWRREAKKRGMSLTTLIVLSVNSYTKIEEEND